MSSLSIVLLILLCYACICDLQVLPGLFPTTYCKKSSKNACKSELFVFSDRMQSQFSAIPYEPQRFRECISTGATYVAENLGQILFGQRIKQTQIMLNFNEDIGCGNICMNVYSKKSKADMNAYKNLISGIKMDYRRYWLVDNLPVLNCTNSATFCDRNIPLGCHLFNGKPSSGACYKFLASDWRSGVYLFNHFDFLIHYVPVDETDTSSTAMSRIVKVVATPSSVSFKKNLSCSSQSPMILVEDPQSDVSIRFTYSVTFKKTQDKWTTRWEYLFTTTAQAKIRWLSIINSVVVVLFLSGLVAMILIRILRRDIIRYNRLDSAVNECQDEFGWKLIHGDVFRPPQSAMLLSVLFGSGIQIACMTGITLFLASFGFMTPAHRGALASCGLGAFVCLGTAAGFSSARLYKLMGGVMWKSNVLLTATFCPGIIFCVSLCLNSVLLALQSSATVPFLTIFALLSMWLGVSLPLCFVGAFFGFKKPVISVPVRTNQIPRQIPKQSIYSSNLFVVILGGMLPFGSIFIELFFIYDSLWGNQLFIMFSLLFVIFIVLLITTSETTILLCYFQLCAENYRWWWRTFFSGGSTSLYILAYSAHYYFTKTEYSGMASAFLFFSYTAIIAWLVFLMLGAIGLLSAFMFVRKIYGVVKVD